MLTLSSDTWVWTARSGRIGRNRGLGPVEFGSQAASRTVGPRRVRVESERLVVDAAAVGGLSLLLLRPLTDELRGGLARE